MLVVANRLEIADGHEEQFLELFIERFGDTETQPGLETVEILQPLDADHFVVQSYWRSRETFEQWRNSEAFEEAHADLPSEMFVGSPALDLYELTVVTGPGQDSSAAKSS